MIYSRCECLRNECCNKNHELSCSIDDWNIQRMWFLAHRFQFHVCELIGSFEVLTLFCYIVSFFCDIFSLWVSVKCLPKWEGEISKCDWGWTVCKTCPTKRCCQIQVSENVQSFLKYGFVHIHCRLFSPFWWYVSRWNGYRDENENCLSVLAIEFFVKHV